MNKKTIRDIDVKGKKVIVRCDFNVPLDENGNITDNRRIVGALDTIKYLLEQNAKIILVSHLGESKDLDLKPNTGIDSSKTFSTDSKGERSVYYLY